MYIVQNSNVTIGYTVKVNPPLSFSPLILSPYKTTLASFLLSFHRCGRCTEEGLMYIFFKDFIYLFFREGKEEEREGETHQCVATSCAPPIGDPAPQCRHVP